MVINSGNFVCRGHVKSCIPILMCWFAWCERNNAKHNNLGFSVSMIIWRVKDFIIKLLCTSLLRNKHWRGDDFEADLIGISLYNGRRHVVPITVNWKSPIDPWIKFNVDGSCANAVSAGEGIARDSQGNCLFAFAEPLGDTDTILTELLALKRGLQLCVARGFSSIWIELDALMVVNLVKGNIKGSWNLATPLTQVRKLLDGREYSITHIYREGNKVADALTNEGKTLDQIIVSESPTSLIRGLVQADKLGFPNFR